MDVVSTPFPPPSRTRTRQLGIHVTNQSDILKQHLFFKIHIRAFLRIFNGWPLCIYYNPPMLPIVPKFVPKSTVSWPNRTGHGPSRPSVATQPIVRVSIMSIYGQWVSRRVSPD
ncbi:hypothetical protein VFPPC_16829 [Pochonia chlamydosporia 170]|uniref:Uncharacterized protein n=1 Tax=Pochonia chlamydosporia 170 TaxID=1380566 RepID=A0A179F3Q1_METCM|nr:hypothetical protein VFPPC_16829 [Pochonia chlamydosporia 170]OAQ60038.1 hypothetical protein VFPPC_16829 [Pochonia chlamydosporia 170]